MKYDQKCLELAQHFLGDEYAEELAERIQATVEDYFSDLEEVRNYDRDR